MNSSLLLSLSVLVNMVISYIIFSIACGGFSWPVHHGDLFHVVFYWIVTVGLALFNTRIGRR